MRAIRHYHASGILPEPERTRGGYRDYTLDDVSAVLTIRSLVDAGLTLAEIAAGQSQREEMIARADDRLSARIRQLERSRALLRQHQRGEIGLPADLRTALDELAEEYATPDCPLTEVVAREQSALQAMALLGIATPQTWALLREALHCADARAATGQGWQAWVQLGELTPHDPGCTALIAQSVHAHHHGVFAGITSTCDPQAGVLPLGAVDISTQGAQAHALTAVLHHVQESP